MRHVLITGTSSGIGHSLTKHLLEEGFTVWAGLRQTQIMAELLARYPQKLHVLKLDVTSTDDIEAAWKQISADPSIEEFSLINNAGVAIGNPLEAIPISEWRKVFDVNVFGLVEVTRKFLPLLRKSRGCVVNIGSISGRMGIPFMAPYCGSKFAVRAITDCLRREMLDHGVRVVLIEAASIDTPIWNKSVEKAQHLSKNLSAEMLEVYGKSLKNLEAGVATTAATAAPVSWVTQAVTHALRSPRPRPYYLVGKRIGLTAFMVKHLPTRLLDRILARGFRSTRGKEK